MRPDIAVKVFDRVADRWSLTLAERTALVGDISDKIDDAQVERIVDVLMIFFALLAICPDDAGSAWLRQPNRNELFSGEAPLDRMVGEPGILVAVRRLVESRVNR
jgi:hypothetical protein